MGKHDASNFSFGALEHTGEDVFLVLPVHKGALIGQVVDGSNGEGDASVVIADEVRGSKVVVGQDDVIVDGPVEGRSEDGQQCASEESSDGPATHMMYLNLAAARAPTYSAIFLFP